MSEVITKINTPPKVGFVSLGCAKALTDSELILTQLRAEGYETSKTYAGADLVIVNTCGFIDDAVKESLDTIGEALALTIDLKLPVVYETHGQGIPDDMRVAQAHNLVSKAVALSVHSADEKERLMYEFGGAVADDMGISGGALAAENFDGGLRAAQRSGR